MHNRYAAIRILKLFLFIFIILMQLMHCFQVTGEWKKFVPNDEEEAIDDAPRYCTFDGTLFESPPYEDDNRVVVTLDRPSSPLGNNGLLDSANGASGPGDRIDQLQLVFGEPRRRLPAATISDDDFCEEYDLECISFETLKAQPQEFVVHRSHRLSMLKDSDDIARGIIGLTSIDQRHACTKIEKHLKIRN
jgi:hypothetical protein